MEVAVEVDPAEDAARRAAYAAREDADELDDVAADHDVGANAPNEAMGAQGGTRADAARRADAMSPSRAAWRSISFVPTVCSLRAARCATRKTRGVVARGDRRVMRFRLGYRTDSRRKIISPVGVSEWGRRRRVITQIDVRAVRDGRRRTSIISMDKKRA